MSEHDMLEVLASASIFVGLDRRDLAELAHVGRHRELGAGDVLWQQGDEARGMAVVVSGEIAASIRLPGNRSMHVATLGPGEALGELPLIDGGPHSATAQAAGPAGVLFLGRADVTAILARDDRAALAIKRRMVGVTTTRLRRQLGLLADSLESAPDPVSEIDPWRPAAREPAARPDAAYIQRMAAFHDVAPSALEAVLDAGRLVRCGRGDTLVHEGSPAEAFGLVVSGAVELVIVRGDRRIRVGLAGPGQTFGSEGLIDGRPAPATAVARERAVVLAIERDTCERLLDGQDAASHALLDLLNRDLASWLRRALRPQAHLGVQSVG